MSESIARTSSYKVRSPIAFTAALLLVTLVHWFALAQPVLADQPNKQARQKVNEGLKQYSSGNYEQAAKSFAEAAQAAPDNPIIKFDEACAVSAAGDDDKARELLLQASVSSDSQVSAAACYNLAAIAAKRGRKELGQDPMAVAPEVRQAALDKLKIAVTHYRDCLRIAPEHQDARHNLELVLTLTNYLQQQWQIRDHQQALEKMSLFELLKHLDDQQLSLRSTTLPYKGQSAAKVSRFDRSKMANQQLKLLDDIPTLKSKIDAQLANSPEESAPTPSGTPSSEPSQQSEVEAQLRKMVTEQLDQASQAVGQAAEDVRSANWDRALDRQRFTNECFRQLQALFSAFPENLDLAIELQESLIETSEKTPSSSNPPSAMAAKKDSSTDGQAWQQDWVSNFSQSLAAKANATLQSLPADVLESMPEEPPVKDLPESENQNDSNEASQPEVSQPEVSQESTSQTDVKKPELDSSEVIELTPEQQQLKQQEEFTKQLRKALERTVELAPTILERSNEAKRLIVDSQSSAARPAQDDVLRMLKEIRDLLPKQPNQQQDQNQNKDQNNKDQKDSDQQKQNDQEDAKSEDQKQKPENGQDKKQDKDQNSDKSDQNDDGDKSQPEKKPETEKPQPKDKSEEAEKKSPSEQAKEQAKEQAAKESEKTNPDGKAAEQTAQQIAEQRAQAVLRRIREREAKYRELLQQLRERQAQQTPVEKDW